MSQIKVKPLIFSIVVVLFADKIFGLADYAKMAADQLESIRKMLTVVHDLEPSLNNQLKTVKVTLFGFDLDPRVTQLDDILKRNAGKSGVDQCQTIYDNGVVAMNQQLQNIAWVDINILLNHLKNVSTTLQNVQGELSGDKLKQAIRTCTEGRIGCPITTNFAPSIQDAEKTMNIQMKGVGEPGLAKRIVNGLGAEDKYNIINDNVLNPVAQCLNSINVSYQKPKFDSKSKGKTGKK